MRTLVVAGVIAAVSAQTAWAASEADQTNGTLVDILLQFFPWLLVFLLIWYVVFRKLKDLRGNSEFYREHVQRSVAHMDRVEQQNERIIALLENIAKK